MWDELREQYQRCSDRNAYLAANPTDPDWLELDARASRSDAKFGRLRNALATWAGVSVDALCLLLAGD